jgi:Na+-transporting NADH:ubiquinone oxidoreductase subunit F
MKAIILDVLEREIDIKMNFFFGAVTKRDLYYIDYFKDLADKNDNLSFIPALSNPAPDDNWDGEVGLITDVVARHIDDGSQMEGYLCGSPGMINACLKVLDGKGVTEDKIFYDKF